MLTSRSKLSLLALLLAASHVTATPTTGYKGFADIQEMPFARSDMTVTSFDPAGESETTRMYLIGGCAEHQICEDPNSNVCFCPALTNKTQYYLPEDDRYETACADAPRERYRHAAAERNGVIYLFGGRDANDNIVTEIDAYDIAANSWSTPCGWPAASSDNTAFTDTGAIYLTGGYPGDYSAAVSELLLFDPASCTFTPRSPMPTARGDVASISVSVAGGGERHFVIGGFINDFCNGEKVVESYLAATDRWESHQGLQLGRADMALGEIDGHVFAIGGETVNAGCNTSIPVPDVERLDAGPASNYSARWAVESDIPSDRFRFIAASYKRSILLFGGQGTWTKNLPEGGKAGFPIHKTALIYIPDDFGVGLRQRTSLEPSTFAATPASTVSPPGAGAGGAGAGSSAGSRPLARGTVISLLLGLATVTTGVSW